MAGEAEEGRGGESGWCWWVGIREGVEMMFSVLYCEVCGIYMVREGKHSRGAFACMGKRAWIREIPVLEILLDVGRGI